MNPHRTQPIEIQPGRRARRQAERRKKLRQHLMASVAITFLAAVLVLVFGQSSEPPLVTATLPDQPEPEEEVVNDEGFVLDRESVLAPVASGRPVKGPERPSQRVSGPGGTSGTGQPPPSISAIPAPPVGEPPAPAGVAKETPAPADDIDEETRPPVETNTQDPPAEDQQPELPEEVCWQGWTYDADRQECIREDELEPSGKNEDAAEEEQETVEEEEESSRSDDLGVGNDLGGGISKGNGSVIRKGNE